MKLGNLFFAFVMSAAWAVTASAKETAPSVRKPSSIRVIAAACKRCAEMKALEDQFNNLKFQVDTDRTKGYDLLNRAMPYADMAEKIFVNSNPDVREFEAFVRLSAAANPYDGETMMADAVASVMVHSPSLTPVYTRTLPTIEDCRRANFKVMVTIHACQTALKAGQEEDSCGNGEIPDIGECLKSKK